MPKYEVSSEHAVDLADGRVVGNGESVTLTDSDIKDEFNSALIDNGTLVEAPSKKKSNKESN